MLTGRLIDLEDSTLKMRVDGVLCRVKIRRNQKPIEELMINEEVQVIAKIESFSMKEGFKDMTFFEDGEVVYSET